MNPDLLLVLCSGMIFLFTVVLALFFPNPSDFRHQTFRVLLALSAAGVAAALPGFIQISTELDQTVIRAGGALAVFVLVYLVDPTRDKQTSPSIGQNLLLILLLCGAIYGGSSLWPYIAKADWWSFSLPPWPILAREADLVINDTQYSSNTDGLSVTLTSIEFTDDNRMRWHLTFQNQSGQDRTLNFNYGRTYLFDDQGRRYELRQVDTGLDPTGTYAAEIQLGLRQDYWFEFEAPQPGTATLQFVLADANPLPFIGVEFPTPLFVLDLTNH